ncbi:MAG: TolB family protein [Anaerolineales bacterium]|nr:TolB family protein [Anaerolineales bacterium]
MNKPALYPRIVLLLTGLSLLVAGATGCEATPTAAVSTEVPAELPLPTGMPSATPLAPVSPAIPVEIPGLVLMSLSEGGHYHLFAYSPQGLPLTRLTADPWDDITPALSPDGKWIAYASRRNGYWDLYALSLETGQVVRLTDTPEYEAAPSWSPDSQWIVYATYLNDNMEIYVRSVTDLASPPLPVTADPAADYAPVWSPLGRHVAFISNRSGEPEVWIADLNQVGAERFSNVSRSPETIESHPAWSPDGSFLAWGAASFDSGLTGVYIWDSTQPQIAARWLGTGDWPIWQGQNLIVTRLPTPNQTYLTAYAVASGELRLPPTLVPGLLHGLVALPALPLPLPGPLASAALAAPPALFQTGITPPPDVPGGRANLVPLQDVEAPNPQLHDMVDEAFQALRLRVASEVGWDVLGSLENAYVPLTTVLEPGLGEDWLYTGRAFSLSPVLVNAGWIAVVREDFGAQTYWRVYLRARTRDGSQGEPLTQVPWDLSTRYSGDPSAYEEGGTLMTSVPPGYWLDLTALAAQYGWERLPSLANWRSYFNGIRFNEFAMTQGLDWRSAMLELYPPEALITPTLVIPPTRTPTRTPRGYQTPTTTRTPTPRPTFTP